MPEGIRKKVITVIFAGAALVAYLAFRRLTGLSVPCFFHMITGLKCPGCGVTRMLDALLSLDFNKARDANIFLFYTGPFFAFELIYEFILPHKSKTFDKINNVLLVIYCIALVIFGILRNVDTVGAFLHRPVIEFQHFTIEPEML